MKRFKGFLYAAIAAATYGTNPVFAVPLYEQGMNANSVLLFRYLLGLPLIALLAFARGRSLTLRRPQILSVGVLGLLMALSSLTLFESYNVMNSGVASTLLFVYPVLTAVLMAFFFHERFRVSTGLCLLLMLAGLALLMRDESGQPVSTFGCCLVMLSALTYALYLVMVNVSRAVRSVPTLALLFYVLLSGSAVFVFVLACGGRLAVPHDGGQWLRLLALAFFPTVVSLVCTTLAIQSIGSTPTAIFGAFEPVTAVVLSVAVLGQAITGRELLGGALIVVAASLVIGGDSVDGVLLRMRRMFPPLRRRR